MSVSRFSVFRAGAAALLCAVTAGCNAPQGATPDDVEVSADVLGRVAQDIRGNCTPTQTGPERSPSYVKTRYYCPAGDFYAVIYDGTESRMQVRVSDLAAARALFGWQVPAERMAGPKLVGA